MRARWFLGMLLVAGSLSPSRGAAHKPCPPIGDMNDSLRLLLIHCLGIGAGADEVARLAPDFRQGVPYDRNHLLSDGTVPVMVFDQHAKLQFNFMGDSLYAFFYHLDLPSMLGDSLFDRVVAFYTQHYGPARVEDGQDSPYYVKFRIWCTADYEVGVTCSLAGKRRLLGWGFQALGANCRRTMDAK